MPLQAGQASITINSGFGNSRVTLLPLTVVAEGASAPAPLSDADRGRRLFVAKGCFNCHAHRDIESQPIGPIGPDLTDRHLTADYLRRQIGNPPSSGKMPNLDLRAAEIEAIVGFLNAERR
jgi:mono/diheme cytochrome c family protein